MPNIKEKLPPIAGNKGDLVTRRCEIVTFRRTVLKLFNPFMPIVPTFAVRETHVSRHNGGTTGAPLIPLRVDSAVKALSSLTGLRGALKC